MNQRSALHIPLGIDAHTGEPVSLPLDAFRRGGYFTGQSGQGKSSTMCRLLTTLARIGSPALVIDDAGECFQQLEKFVAFYAATLDRALAAVGVPTHARQRVVQQKVLRRFTFGFIGHGRENAAGIDLLKRRQLPGRRESVEEVVVGALKPFEARFQDMALRTRFVRVFRPLITALVAGERPITEAEPLLLDPRYADFLRREIERVGTLEDPESRPFVLPQLKNLRRILDLRRNKEGSEIEPYPQRYWDRIESTWNAIEPFTAGGVVGRFFDADSFAPEEVVFHNGVFAVTSNLSDTLTRNQAMASVYAVHERLMKHRTPEMGFERLSRRRLFVVLDEIRWFFPDLTWFLSVARNHRVSTFILNQQDEQWAQLGMPALADTVPSLLRLRLRYRAQTEVTARDMAMTAGKYDPWALQQLARTKSRATGRATGTGAVVSHSDTISESSGTVYGTSAGAGASFGSSAGWYADDDSVGYSGGSNDGHSLNDGWSESESSQRGSASTTGTARSRNQVESATETEIEHLLNVGVSEQQFLRAQDMRSLPEHVAQVSFEGQTRLVRMARFEGFPKRLDGVDIYAAYRRSALEDLARRRTARKAYEPGVTVARPATPVTDERVRPGKRTPDGGPKRPKGGPKA
ncbi:MAG: hypothetical protein ACXW4P_03765 [Thermoanaerobaculia bacterium]